MRRVAVNIMITGNQGYVGPVVVEALRRSRPDARLVGVDTGLFAHCLTNVTQSPEVYLDAQVVKDVRDLDVADLAGVDAVVHLAAISNDPIGNRYEDVTVDINQNAAVATAKAAKAAGASHFVFASSCSVYGTAEDGNARDETSATGPLTAYARSKVGAETALAALADDNFTVTCLRFATACGMSPRLRLDLVLNDFVAGAVAGGEITILSDGSPWRPLIHVRDMARAIDWAIDRPASAGGQALIVNAGRDDWNVQVRDLAAAVADAMPGVAVNLGPAAAPDPRSYRVSFARFRELAPDHQPLVDLSAAVAELRDGLRAWGFADAEFRESPLMRLNTVASLRDSGRLDDTLRWAPLTPAQ